MFVVEGFVRHEGEIDLKIGSGSNEPWNMRKRRFPIKKLLNNDVMQQSLYVLRRKKNCLDWDLNPGPLLACPNTLAIWRSWVQIPAWTIFF